MARQHITFLVLIVAFAAGDTFAQPTPGFNNKIPVSIMTPDTGWLCLLRLKSPTEAWFENTWRPGEIELVE